MIKNYLPKSLYKNSALCFSITLCLLLGLSSHNVLAQNNGQFSREVTIPVCIYKPSPNVQRVSRPVPAQIKSKIESRDTPCANFDVTYIGFDGNQAAQDAFQYAVDIWSYSIESSVQITMIARFEDLGDTGTLGSAGPATINTSGDAGIDPNFWYAKALFEKLRGFDDSITGDSNDINARFNSNPSVNWYYGTDANPPAGQFDFVSVVLHEIGHGLGFTGGADVDAGEGSIRVEFNPSTIIPSIYSSVVENNNDVSILTFDDPSTDLGDELTSNNLFSVGASTVAANGGPAKIYAPDSWDPGSSYSHWNEGTFLPGDENSLMTPFISPGEANHNPGSVTLGYFEDLGWTLCESLSTEEFLAEKIAVSPVPFTNSIEIRVPSDANFDQLSIALFDITGKLIVSQDEAAFNGRITLDNLNTLQSNMYFLKITNLRTKQTITKKVVKN